MVDRLKRRNKNSSKNKCKEMRFVCLFVFLINVSASRWDVEYKLNDLIRWVEIDIEEDTAREQREGGFFLERKRERERERERGRETKFVCLFVWFLNVLVNY